MRGDTYMGGYILLIRTLTVEKSSCTVYKFPSFQLTRLSLLFKAEPVIILYCSVLFSHVSHHPAVFVTGIPDDISVCYSKLSPIVTLITNGTCCLLYIFHRTRLFTHADIVSFKSDRRWPQHRSASYLDLLDMCFLWPFEFISRSHIMGQKGGVILISQHLDTIDH